MIVLGSNIEMVMVVHKTIYILIFKKFNLLGRSDAHSHRSVHKCQFEPFSRSWKYHNITSMSLSFSCSLSWKTTKCYSFVFVFFLKSNTILHLCLYFFLRIYHNFIYLSLSFLVPCLEKQRDSTSLTLYFS